MNRTLIVKHTTDRNPLPRWARWLAAVLVVGGYGLLEAHDVQVEQAIAQANTPTPVAARHP